MNVKAKIDIPHEVIGRDAQIAQINTTIVDLPIRRVHKLSGVTMAHQSYVLVEIVTEGGARGWGEGVTPGGPWWSGESVETIKVLIDAHLAPALIGMQADNPRAATARMDQVVAHSPFAKGAVEIGLQDLAARMANMPLSEKFGGRLRDGITVRWALASGDLATDLAEAEDFMARDIAHAFKLKGGLRDPEVELAHCRDVRRALGEHVSIQIDLNNVWNLSTALKWGPRFMEYVDYLEQPVEGWNMEGLAMLRSAGCRVMADESLYSPQDAMRLAKLQAVDILALKTMKSGGLARSAQIAGIAAAAGISCYAGTFMESSLGVAAHVHLAETLPAVTEGGELFGSLWLAEDITEKGVVHRNGKVFAPEGAGHGVTPDPDRVKRFART